MADDCGSMTDHAVLMVGYGSNPSDEDTPYFIVKNSWGPGRGDEGYIKMEMTNDRVGTCGLYTSMSAPQLD